MAADNPLSHVVQHPISQVEADLGFLTPAQKITVLSDQIVMMIVAGLLLTALVPILVRRRAGSDAIGRLVPTVMIFAQSDPPISHTEVEDSSEDALRVAIEAYGLTVGGALERIGAGELTEVARRSTSGWCCRRIRPRRG